MLNFSGRLKVKMSKAYGLRPRTLPDDCEKWPYAALIIQEGCCKVCPDSWVETEKEEEDDEDMGMKHWRRKKINKRNYSAGALDLTLEVVSGFQRQPLKSEKTSQVLMLKVSEPGSWCYAAQHASFGAKKGDSK